jgi:hypothetical protein
MLQSKKAEEKPRENAHTKCQHRNSCANCKTKAIIDAQAEAEKQENLQREADAIFAKMEAEAKVYMKS